MKLNYSSHGFSMISLLIGLVISMVVVVGLMGVYKTVIHSTVQSKLANGVDNTLSSAGLRAGLLLEDAGYGITGASLNTDLILLSGANFTAGSTLTGNLATVGVAANAIVWATSSSNVTQCAALYAPSTGGLYYLGPVGCADATLWSSVVWSSSPVYLPIANAAAAGVYSAPLTFVAAAVGCVPYGISGTTGAYSVTMSGQQSSGMATSNVFCLVNFH